MEFLEPSEEQVGQQILCCECGTLIPPNPANMCIACIRTRVDISENIPKQVKIIKQQQTMTFLTNCYIIVPGGSH